MLVFLDFEASSLNRESYPIEVAWIYEDGHHEAYLIRPAPHWTEWSKRSEAIHRIARAQLEQEGIAHDLVARRMVETLSGHDLLASAPSWDGKWLSVLLRGAGLPRHSLRLRHSADARHESATAILAPVVPPEQLAATVVDLLTQVALQETGRVPAHRALPDAQADWRHWLAVRQAATELAARLGSEGRPSLGHDALQGPSCKGSVPGSGTS